jgi:aspartyl-tRNA synthetase
VKAGDALFFAADADEAARRNAGRAGALRIGRELGLTRRASSSSAGSSIFPMYEWNEDEKRIDFSHNPFSMPNFDREKFLALIRDDKDTILGIKAFQYDIVCNGIELSSGAIRNHDPDVMLKAFEIAGYARRDRRPNSPACSTRSATARRRMAAPRPASTASSC